ncbi:hypothetical protein BpHYR1_053395 [Brachionus plicatilis]|uniref:Uncharacterized protein n=1 Tax=Brachionus plicatilis TaxID=10195 RepID=A0A3M7QX76_BRAPC|nr:hypothetical protein BpHYR1_053395 [Brachionus plicatilis]
MESMLSLVKKVKKVLTCEEAQGKPLIRSGLVVVKEWSNATALPNISWSKKKFTGHSKIKQLKLDVFQNKNFEKHRDIKIAESSRIINESLYTLISLTNSDDFVFQKKKTDRRTAKKIPIKD